MPVGAVFSARRHPSLHGVYWRLTAADATFSVSTLMAQKRSLKTRRDFLIRNFANLSHLKKIRSSKTLFNLQTVDDKPAALFLLPVCAQLSLKRYQIPFLSLK